MMNIYGKYAVTLEKVMENLVEKIKRYNEEQIEKRARRRMNI